MTSEVQVGGKKEWNRGNKKNNKGGECDQSTLFASMEMS
jgi:hypothetical protein